MSLLDALLLEEPTPLGQEIHIALRTDAVAGSGTALDPYDGGTRLGPTLPATLSFDPLDVMAIVQGDDAHGFSSSVTISGVTGESADSYNQSFSGTNFQSIDSYAFKVRLAAAPSDQSPPGPPQIPSNYHISATSGLVTKNVRLYWPVVRLNISFPRYSVVNISGAPDSLLDGDFVVVFTGSNYCWCLLTTYPGGVSGNCTCAQLIHRFDEVMRAAPADSRIRLGPGTFETRGINSAYFSDYNQDLVHVGYLVKTGQKLRGSGIDVTCVKLVHAIDTLSQTTCLITTKASVSHFEASDFTVDCNLSGQPVPGGVGLAPVTCGAVNAIGAHIQLRRLRAINWGCQSYPECFVLTAGGTADGNSVVEECIVEKPSENNTHESTLIGAGGGNADTADGRACVVRNNYINAEYSNGFASHLVRVTSIQRFSPTIALLTTAEPHRHFKFKNLVVRGALVSGSLNNPYNGVFAITEIVSDTQLKYLMYDDPGIGVDADVSGGVTIGHGISSEYIAIAAVEDYTGLTYVHITTKRPHNRTPGQTCIMAGLNALPPGAPAEVTTPFNVSHSTYHRILAVDYDSNFPGDGLHPNRFKIKLPEGVPPWNTPLSYASAAIPVSTHGPAALSGTGCVVEGNHVFDGDVACYTDTGSTRDMVVRNNCWTNVLMGVRHDMSNVGGANVGANGTLDAPISAASLTYDTGDPTLATFQATAAHGYATNDFVLISGAIVGGNANNAYNGLFQITVVDSVKFTYRMAASQSQNASGGSAAKQTAACVTNDENDEYDGLLATFVAPSPHRLLPGDTVDVRLALVNNSPSNSFNGTFTVKSVPSATTFTYELSLLPTGIALGLPTYAFRWQTRRLSIERNRIELRPSSPESVENGRSPAGISLFGHGYSDGPTAADQLAYIFPKVLIRENLVGYFANGTDSTYSGAGNTRGVELAAGDSAVIQGNVLDIKYGSQGGDWRLNELASRQTSYFNNHDSAGNLVRGYSRNTNVLKDELEDAVQSALLLSM
jgi:hypothetical protein